MAYLDTLAAQRVTRVIDELVDIRQYPEELTWVRRIPSVPTVDGEIMARYTGRVTVADVIANDQAAVVRVSNPIRLTQHTAPNLKHGQLITQEMTKLLARINAGMGFARDINIFENYVANTLRMLVAGVYSRMETINWAMLLDSFTYDKMGVKITSGWNMPADLKVTSSPTWVTANAATATPVTDVMTVKRIARQKYGIILDRMTLSTQALMYMTGTTEFQNFARLLFFGQAIPATGLPTQDIAAMQDLAGRVFGGMTIEINDDQTWEEALTGAVSATRYLPENKVLLTPTRADGNTMFWDWANGTVTETVPGTVPNMLGGFDGEREGPVGYVTGADPNGNPPGRIAWGVATGWARKHKEAGSAVITAY